jgi:tRNA A-37 threonylcarbamoyl transferase component Bud32
LLERGVTLAAWAKQERNFFEISTMVERVAQLLAALHEAGRVHRDLKLAENVL